MKTTSFSFIIGFIFTLWGCAATQIGANVDPGTIGVDFTFQRENMCFGPSPQINLENLPTETRGLKVSLRDLDHPGADHGGGDLRDFNAKVIPAGALKGYQGPCPSMSEQRRFHYVFKVEALDAAGKVIAFGQGMRECGWIDFR